MFRERTKKKSNKNRDQLDSSMLLFTYSVQFNVFNLEQHTHKQYIFLQQLGETSARLYSQK